MSTGSAVQRTQQALRTYRAVGWFTLDPFNEHVAPFARVVTLSARSRDEAYDRALDLLTASMSSECALLNWYVDAPG